MLSLKPRKVRTAEGTVTIWYITGKCPLTGQFFRTSTRCRRKSDADAVLKLTEERQREKAKFGIDGVATFGDAVVEYLDKGGEERFLTPLIIEFGDTKLRVITDTDLSAGAKKHYADVTPATLIRQWYGPFQSVWNAASAAKLCPERTFVKPKLGKRKMPRVPTDEWLIAIIKACTRLEQRAAILYMSFSGARASEVVKIKVRDYDRAGRIHLTHTKNDDERVTVLPSFVKAVIDLLPMDDPDAPLFGYASRFSLTRIIKRAAARASLEYFSPHKVGRHLFAKRFLADSHSLRSLMEAGGWRSIGAVMLYSHLEKQAVENAVTGVSTPFSALAITSTLTDTVKKKHAAVLKSKDAEDAVFVDVLDGAAGGD